MNFENKTVLITGGASGIGLETVNLFLNKGANVICVDINKNATNQMNEQGNQAELLYYDVGKKEDVDNLFSYIKNKYGKIDILINNAGIESTKTIFETDEEHWDRVINVNLKSVFLCSKLASEIMKENRNGVIINTASDRGIVGAKGSIAYNASKGGVVLFTKSLALELAEYNIRVNCVCPGAIETPMLRRDINEKEEPNTELTNIVASHPLGRLGQPEEVAKTIMFLASDWSSNITGVALPVDGGYTAQ